MNKNSPPELNTVFVRERLYSLLQQPLPVQSYWVSGPGGAGKTTLISSYVKEHETPCLWYNVDSLDRDISRFFHYFSLAAENSLRAKLSTPSPFPPASSQELSTFITNYFEALFLQSKAERWLVFDNFQEIESNTFLQEILSTILGMAPENVTIVIISRSDLPPFLARFQANQTLAVIDSHNLAFTQQETFGLINQMGGDLSKTDAEKLVKKTQGWAAGIVLWCLQRDKETDFRKTDLDRTPEAVNNYFLGEIFERLPAETKEFLLKIAVFPHVTATMASDLTGQNATTILEELNRQNAFLDKKFSPGPCYQIHPLFRDFLLSVGRNTIDKKDMKNLCAEAAQIAYQHDKIEDAASLLIQAEEHSRLIDIIISQAPVFCSQGQHSIILSWIKSLPEEFSGQTPWILFWKGVSITPENPVEGFATCKKAYDMFSQAEDLTAKTVCWSQIADMYLILRREFKSLDYWIAEGEQLAKIQADSLDPITRIRFVSGMFIALLLRQPDHSEFSMWQKRCEDLLASIDDPQLLLSLVGNLSLSYQWTGDVSKARAMLSILRPLTESEVVFPIVRIGANAMLSGLSLALGNWEESRRYARDGLALGDETGIHIYDFLLLCTETYLQLLVGKLPSAERLLDQMQVKRLPHATWENGHYHFQRAWLAMLQSDSNTALTHIDYCLSITRTSGNPFTIARSILLQSQVLLERDEIDRAKTTLLELVDNKVPHVSKHIDFSLNLVLADCAICDGDRDIAHKHLTRAFSLARKNGVLIPSGLKQSRLSRLSATALQDGIETEQVRNFIMLLRLSPPSSTLNLEYWPRPVQIYTLGRVEIRNYGVPVEFATKLPRKPLELLKVLIAKNHAGKTKEAISEYLWPDADGDRAMQSFSITLHRLRKLLGCDDAVLLENGRVFLNSAICWVDAWHLENLVDQINHNNPTDDKLKSIVHAHYAGPFDFDGSLHSEIQEYSTKLEKKILRNFPEMDG